MALARGQEYDPFDPFASQRERQREMDKSVRPLNDFEAAFKEKFASNPFEKESISSASMVEGRRTEGGGARDNSSPTLLWPTASRLQKSASAFQSQSSLRRELMHLCSESKSGITTASGFTFCKGNEVCADCSVSEPRWGVPYLGIFVCIRCAMVYRTLKGECKCIGCCL